MRSKGVASGRQIMVRGVIGGTWFAGPGRAMPGIGARDRVAEARLWRWVCAAPRSGVNISR